MSGGGPTFSELWRSGGPSGKMIQVMGLIASDPHYQDISKSKHRLIAAQSLFTLNSLVGYTGPACKVRAAIN